MTFGIAVAEAMFAAKAIVVSDKGALPELIETNGSGLVVDSEDPSAWASAIMQLANDKNKAIRLGEQARERAQRLFSVDSFAQNYENFYRALLRGG